MYRLMSSILALIVSQGSIAETPSQQSPVPHQGWWASSDTVVHLFEWRWPDVALECERFLGPKGFRAVQVSPPNEHAVVNGRPWYERYQPVSFKLHSRSGSEGEFREMVQRCQRVGVKVIVDAVINHMAGHPKNHMHRFGTAGTPYSSYDYPGYYGWNDFHRCGFHEDHQIRNYQNRDEVQYCDLLTLTDLRTGSDYVQRTIAGYLENLRRMGVGGVRIDGAKHMPAGDIAAILSRMKAPRDGFEVFHEVIERDNEPIKAHEYFSTGQVTEFRYSAELGRVFHHGHLEWLRTFGPDWGLMSSDKAIVFVDNHDNQRGHGSSGPVVTHKTPALYTLANVFMLAHPYGRPRVMSSYRFDNDFQGPPAYSDGGTKRVWVNGEPQCFDEWQCEHRWVAIANMVQFRRATAAAPYVSHWWRGTENFVAFGRGALGFVVLNRNDYGQHFDLQTGLAPGTYCNVTAGDFEPKGKTCHGETFSVDHKGRLQGYINPMASIALHHLAKF